MRSLLQQHQTEKSCFFLRWPHRVSGFCPELPPDFPSPEGQLFDGQKELRWKPQGQGYSVLLLSSQEPQPGFTPVGDTWSIQNRENHLYLNTETRFPRGIHHRHVNVGQRYFSDPQTATVHFVALTVI